jgi:hypothetical protein
MQTERADIYTRVTHQIIAELEKGVRPWLKPWNAEHAAGRLAALFDDLSAGCDAEFDAACDDIEREFVELRLTFTE